MTNPASIQAVQAKQLNNGKYEFTAILEDGSKEIIKKAGVFKPIVNVYDQRVNNTRNFAGLSRHCRYNSKAGVKWGWRIKFAPIKSIEVELV